MIVKCKGKKSRG